MLTKGSFIFSIVLFILAVASERIPAAEPIKIGILSPPHSELLDGFKPYLWGAEMAVAEVNAREGKQGIQLLLVLRGGNFEQEKELKDLREFIIEERVHFLLGKVRQGSIIPLAKLAQEQKIPLLIFPVNFLEVASTAREPSNLFWISPAPESFQRAAVRTAAQFSQSRIFLLARDSDTGKSWAKYFWETMRRLKPDTQPEGEIFLSEKGEDFERCIRNILASKAEVCMSHLGSEEWIRFALAGKKQGYFKKIMHFELESATPEVWMALKKDAPEGVWGINTFPFWFLEGKETQDFVNKFRKKTSFYPGVDALSGYGSIYALFEAMKKAGSIDSEKVIDALGGLSFPTPVGTLTIRKADRRALWPVWGGVSKKVVTYPFPILKELKAFGPDSFLTPSPQEESSTESPFKEKTR